MEHKLNIPSPGQSPEKSRKTLSPYRIHETIAQIENDFSEFENNIELKADFMATYLRQRFVTPYVTLSWPELSKISILSITVLAFLLSLEKTDLTTLSLCAVLLFTEFFDNSVFYNYYKYILYPFAISVIIDFLWLIFLCGVFLQRIFFLKLKWIQGMNH